MEQVTSRLSELSLGQVPVYLLKTRSSPTDSYEDHFSRLENGRYKPIFVPVLEHMFMDDALRKMRLAAERYAFAGGSPATKRQKACNNAARKYSGLIFTSQRAVDAFAMVVMKLDPEKLEMLFDREMPIYVVGPATARAVRSLELPCPVVGEEAGNGEALAHFILDHQKTISSEVTHLDGRRLPLLFLVGEQRRDIIPTTLRSEHLPPGDRIPVVELIVYETGESTTFEEDFHDLIREAKRAKISEQWVVVFSPQGCEAMLMGLGWLDAKGGKFNAGRREIMSGPMKTKVATIGPTTRDYLESEFGFEPDVCAATPGPEGVGDGIVRFGR